MKTETPAPRNTSNLRPWAAALAVALLLWPGHARSAPASADAKMPEPKIQMDPAAVARDGKSLTSFAPVIKKVAPSVVTIYTTKILKQDPRRMPMFDDPIWRRFFGLEDEDAPGTQPRQRPRQFREQNLGSGVIISADGYLLSNHHVVDGADELKVALPNGKEEYLAKLVGSDAASDIAVLKIEATNLPAITMTDSDNLQVGDIVLALGNPFGVGQTVTMGIVSGLGRSMGIVNYEDFIQTDASINPGNSGGALVDAEGRLVGVNTAILSRTGGNVGVGFAVPANMARNIMQQIIQNGKVVRGYLGIRLQPLTPQLQKAFKLPDLSGALVGEVTARSPAAEAGIKDGDVIIEFNGRKVADFRQLRLLASQTAPKTKVNVKLLREGKEKTVSVTLGELPDDIAMGGEPKSPSGEGSDLLDGVEMADLDSRARRQFALPSDLQGALVTRVNEDSPASAAGLKPGDVILEINHKEVSGVDDAIEQARQTKGKSLLLRVWSNGTRRYVAIEEAKK
jgi:serine protease Do